MKYSIIIPVFNVEKYLDRCIDSILKQTYQNYELIFINDASTDLSLNILKDYEKKYSQKIKIYSFNTRTLRPYNRGPESKKRIWRQGLYAQG